jgi:prophage regulatory protein
MKLLSQNDLRSKGINFSRSQLYQLISIGHFPRPVKMGLRLNAWVESEIDAWIEQRVTERDRGAA